MRNLTPGAQGPVQQQHDENCRAGAEWGGVWARVVGLCLNICRCVHLCNCRFLYNVGNFEFLLLWLQRI